MSGSSSSRSVLRPATSFAWKVIYAECTEKRTTGNINRREKKKNEMNYVATDSREQGRPFSLHQLIRLALPFTLHNIFFSVPSQKQCFNFKALRRSVLLLFSLLPATPAKSPFLRLLISLIIFVGRANFSAWKHTNSVCNISKPLPLCSG